MLYTNEGYKLLLVLYKFARCQCESISANNAFNIYFGTGYTSFQQRLETALTIPFGLYSIQPAACSFISMLSSEDLFQTAAQC